MDLIEARMKWTHHLHSGKLYRKSRSETQILKLGEKKHRSMQKLEGMNDKKLPTSSKIYARNINSMVKANYDDFLPVAFC